MSVSEANRRFGSKWRKDPTEARFYLRRKKYYDAIESVAPKNDTSTEKAAEELELARQEANQSLNAFVKTLHTFI
ncbi:hypothetical protein P3T76_002010 [Phytophthora citrophthora]|uniref:Transcription activator GCR1-like domain-containing protein n=1 Tax=Phytophthora citrophthora TaxID=4793 RepID=A0AAD9GXA3_9STRA|nr:hypothetical protein P3T76_002010 [Phytophthora citrophthora]